MIKRKCRIKVICGPDKFNKSTCFYIQWKGRHISTYPKCMSKVFWHTIILQQCKPANDKLDRYGWRLAMRNCHIRVNRKRRNKTIFQVHQSGYVHFHLAGTTFQSYTLLYQYTSISITWCSLFLGLVLCLLIQWACVSSQGVNMDG